LGEKFYLGGWDFCENLLYVLEHGPVVCGTQRVDVQGPAQVVAHIPVVIRIIPTMPINHSFLLLGNQSIETPLNQSFHQSIIPPINHSTNQSKHPSIITYVNQSFHQSFKTPINHHSHHQNIHQPIIQSKQPSINHSINQSKKRNQETDPSETTAGPMFKKRFDNTCGLVLAYEMFFLSQSRMFYTLFLHS